jgi:hypothetical protein
MMKNQQANTNQKTVFWQNAQCCWKRTKFITRLGLTNPKWSVALPVSILMIVLWLYWRSKNRNCKGPNGQPRTAPHPWDSAPGDDAKMMLSMLMLDSLIHSCVDHLATLHLEWQKKMSLKAIEDLNAILRSQCRYFPDGPDGYYSWCPPLPRSDIVINHCGSDRNLCIQAARPCFLYATFFSRVPIRHCVLTLDFGHQPHTCALRSIRGGFQIPALITLTWDSAWLSMCLSLVIWVIWVIWVSWLPAVLSFWFRANAWEDFFQAKSEKMGMTRYDLCAKSTYNSFRS